MFSTTELKSVKNRTRSVYCCCYISCSNNPSEFSSLLYWLLCLLLVENKQDASMAKYSIILMSEIIVFLKKDSHICLACNFKILGNNPWIYAYEKRKPLGRQSQVACPSASTLNQNIAIIQSYFSFLTPKKPYFSNFFIIEPKSHVSIVQSSGKTQVLCEHWEHKFTLTASHLHPNYSYIGLEKIQAKATIPDF